MNEAQRATLFGVATGTPDGGVAIIRISGPDACSVAERVTGRQLGAPRMLVRRALRVQGGAEDALVVWMRAPSSFTGEDVVELHVHAGVVNVRLVCDAVSAAGAAPAGPGDFSRRAFELGRLTLDEAEGLAAVIGAQSEAALTQARRLVGGELGRAVDGLRARIVELQAEVEANLDFPEDVAEEAMSRWTDEVAEFGRELAGWLSRFEAGRRVRERPRVVLAGPANAGKSSLFNALLGHARALTSAQPGTTRDYVEAELEVGGYVCTVVDTAGIRSSDDAVERAGVRRSAEQAQEADVVLWIEAADTAADPARRAAALSGRDGFVVDVESKRDLGVRRADWVGVRTHGREGEGLEEVRSALLRWFAAGVDAPWIGLRRHREHAERAAASVSEALGLLATDAHLELGAFALASAAARLGEITGRSGAGPVGEEVLARIFARFCIGK